VIPVTVFGALGRMGRILLAENSSDIEIVQAIDREDPLEIHPDSRVVMDFSIPEAWNSLDTLLSSGKAALVSGTTGIGDQQKTLLRKWSAERPVFYSSNMSVGIHVLGRLMAQADAMLDSSFDRELIEFHHGAKVDSPSGTALSLLKNWPGERVHGRKGNTGMRPRGEIGVHSVRGGDVAGEHHLHYMGQGERIVLSHIATDRRVFALGAIRAAMFICGRGKGLYGMEDMLG